MLLSVQVDATGSLFDGHDREAYIDAAMKFSFLDLRKMIIYINDGSLKFVCYKTFPFCQ